MIDTTENDIYLKEIKMMINMFIKIVLKTNTQININIEVVLMLISSSKGKERGDLKIKQIDKIEVLIGPRDKIILMLSHNLKFHPNLNKLQIN